MQFVQVQSKVRFEVDHAMVISHFVSLLLFGVGVSLLIVYVYSSPKKNACTGHLNFGTEIFIYILGLY